MFSVIRILLGLVFLVSGLEKVISPYQNFLYVLQSYQVLPGWAETIVARVFPWLELFVGLFVTLGLWCRAALGALMTMCAVFIATVGQALLRGLELDQCGCFGEWISIPPGQILIFDSALLLLAVLLLRYPSKTETFGLDSRFPQ